MLPSFASLLVSRVSGTSSPPLSRRELPRGRGMGRTSLGGLVVQERGRREGGAGPELDRREGSRGDKVEARERLVWSGAPAEGL